MPKHVIELTPDELLVLRRNLEEYRQALTAHIAGVDKSQPNVASVHARISNIGVLLKKLPHGQ